MTKRRKAKVPADKAAWLLNEFRTQPEKVKNFCRLFGIDVEEINAIIFGKPKGKKNRLKEST